jgi:hypothetical protein
LEFRGGTSSRPILSPAGDGAPIDGGTRVEVLLKSDPVGPDGLLYAGAYTRAIPLARLVGAVAPNLDVALFVGHDEIDKPVLRPGDWLLMKGLELVRRLNPLLSRSDVEKRKNDRSLMMPLVDDEGRVFGRAFINANFWSSSTAGWVTVSGLRASEMQNLHGVLLGEAMTAARDAALPSVGARVLARWASQQAALIAEIVADEERQATSAEVVLECGGDIGALTIVRWGADWLNTAELEERLRLSEEFIVTFTGEFDYDEEIDSVHPKEFRDSFKQAASVAIVPLHNGAILTARNYSWPQALTGRTVRGESNIAAHVRSVVARVWGGNFEEQDDDRTVGRVHHEEIIRSVTVFRRMDAEEE